MKKTKYQVLLAAFACVAVSAATALAQGTSAPALPAGVQEILRLEQAKISDDVVIAFVKNSPKSYTLTADQIIYLRQQGLSNPVIATMVNQGATAPSPAPATPPAAATTATSAPPQQPAPPVTYVQSAPATTVYYTQPYYYYQPYPVYGYGWYPPVSVSFGWGWGWGWHGGWHGGRR